MKNLKIMLIYANFKKKFQTFLRKPGTVIKKFRRSLKENRKRFQNIFLKQIWSNYKKKIQRNICENLGYKKTWRNVQENSGKFS